jgi:VanZ family protein
MARSFQTWSIKTIAQTAWITAVLFGVTDEWHQSWIPGREMDPWDWAADSIGSGLGLILWGLLKYPNIPSHSSPWPNL